MTENVVNVDGLSVAYRIYPKPSDVLREILTGSVRHETFWALRGVNLSIGEGERVGIVGANGAGKSTLLKVIAGTMSATAGRVTRNGSISSLLSMVPAWNEDETGIDNIRFNLTLQGVPERSISGMIDEIVDFTELGRHIYNPVKTYSTGMGARLSFAIATATEPDILIVDEVLGTGDGYFAWKATKRMKDFCARGRAVILVSHSMAAIQSLCTRTVWLQNGEVRMDGRTSEVLPRYELDFRRAEDEALRARRSASTPELVTVGELTPPDLLRMRIVPQTEAPFYSHHLVGKISVAWDGGAATDLSLEHVDVSRVDVDGALDLIASQWSRLMERGGRQGRGLTRVAGRDFGGQFLVRVPAQPCDKATVTVALTTSSDDDSEQLCLQRLDMISGEWKSLELISRTDRAGWATSHWSAPWVRPDGEHVGRVAAKAEQRAKPEVAIDRVAVLVGDQEVASVGERSPFDIEVVLNVHDPVECADVGMKLTRLDGTYVFWQSSGQAGANLERPSGTMCVVFHFDPNMLGAGEYSVCVTVANGWRYPENYPYSVVYDRNVNAGLFRVVPEFDGLDMGLVNCRVPVSIRPVQPDLLSNAGGVMEQPTSA